MGIAFSFQVWTTFDYENEIRLIDLRAKKNNKYPDGVECSIRIIESAYERQKPLKVIALKTFPWWTWYIRI